VRWVKRLGAWESGRPSFSTDALVKSSYMYTARLIAPLSLDRQKYVLRRPRPSALHVRHSYPNALRASPRALGASATPLAYPVLLLFLTVRSTHNKKNPAQRPHRKTDRARGGGAVPRLSGNERYNTAAPPVENV